MAAKEQIKELMDAGVHFGHLKRKWNPNMAPYIFMEKNGIHIIDLHKTAVRLDEASAALRQIAKSGKKILFVATKKQAKAIVEKKVKPTKMPFVTERWPGGMLTNFATIRKAIRKMTTIDKMMADGTVENMAKKERLTLSRKKAKLEKLLGSIADLHRLPAAIFIVDIMKEHIAVEEAKKLNIPTFAIVDTNSDPRLVDFPIPANDDASQSIEKIMDHIVGAVTEGLDERNATREKQAMEAQKRKEEKEQKEQQEAEEKAKADAEKSSEKPAAEKVGSSSDSDKKEGEGKEEKSAGKRTTARKRTTKPSAVSKKAEDKKEKAKE